MIKIDSIVRLELASVLLLAIVAGCTHIPENPHKSISYSMDPASEGLLVATSQDVLDGAEPGEAALMLIPDNTDALNWRLALIDHAQVSIDLQVFIWSNDESGRLMLDRIIKAAERGVKVRLLLDDMPKDWSDRVTALVARAPNIQVRRFNPGRVRKGLISRTYQMSTQFRTLNRRMHNKQLVVDGCWGIIGGRNIGNPYFGLSTKYNNRDLDLLMTGPIIQQLADDFDEYWNAPATYPGEAMYKEIASAQKDKVRKRFEQEVVDDRCLLEPTTIPVEPQDWSRELAGLETNMVFGIAHSLQDSPEVKGDRGIRLEEQIIEATPNARHVSSIITPYMIPSKEQIAGIERAVKEEGRRIRILVPSMESNNHTMAHSHYKKYRKKLLNAGAELYELRGQPSAEMRAMSDTAPVKSKFISLHTKGFILDEEWVLLGSLNIDPRSIRINTEHMIIIQSEDLARQMQADFDWMVDPSNAWQVTLNENGDLRWTSTDGVMKRQPARSVGQRWSDFFYRLLPIESQL